jgi:hypothetical protein
VGTNVKVLVFADGKLCGENKIYDRDFRELGNFNDRISSLIVFPKKLAHPQGVDLLIPKKSGWASAGKEVSFYPLPEPASSSEARYAAIGDYWNDKAVAIRLYGPVEVVLYKNVHFQDPSMKFPGMLGAKDYYILKDYQFDKVTSSLIVRTRATAQAPSPPAIQPVKPLQPTEKPIQPLKPIQPPITLITKIQGKWFSNIGVVYHIKQNGNNFTWLAKGGKEVGHGNISGSNLSATWQGPGGSGQATGTVKQMQGNQATRIEWNNGVVFKR